MSIPLPRRSAPPTILCGLDGEPPTYVSLFVAETAQEAITVAEQSGEIFGPNPRKVTRVLMRELDPIACKIRGVDEGWWVECTKRARDAQPFWRLDE